MKKAMLSLEYITEFGDRTRLETSLLETEPDLNQMEVIINGFLKACTFPGFNKNRVLLTSMSDKEAEALMDFLIDYRANHKGEEE